jgi:hypothetical protein
MKNVTGNSTNTITGFYSKSVTQDYTKTIVGTSTNVITGIYSKTVHSNYLKQVKGTSSNAVIGDYSKILSANYVKVVTGNSNVQVTSESIVQYIGNHSRSFGNNHKQYIAGQNTHTTIGPTIRTEIDVAVTQQIQSHIEAHPTNLVQEKNQWFSTAVAKGTWQKALKLDFTTGPAISGAILKVDTNVLNFGINSTTSAIFVHKGDFGVVTNKMVSFDNNVAGFKTKVGAIKTSAFASANRAYGATAHAGGAVLDFLGGKFQALGAKIQAGVTWAINQFM